MCTLSEAKLKEHSDSKHPKNTFFECFPHLTPVRRCKLITLA